jgi:phosphoribosylformylglycinamidine cyclo-ligase
MANSRRHRGSDRSGGAARKGGGRTRSRAPDSRAAPPGAGADGARSGLTYADSGVDLVTYDRFIDALGGLVRRTRTPRVIDNEGGFAGLFRLDYNEKLFKRNYRDPVLVACTDGVGTKVKLATQLGIFDTVGIDLVAMSVNDLIVQGAEPLFFLDYIAVAKVDEQQLLAMVKGVTEGCRQCGAALLGGETAEMPDLYAPGEFDMAGFAVGVVDLKRAINPVRVEKGDVVLGLASSGLHSNGYSLVRKIVDHARLDLHRVYEDALDETEADDDHTPLGRVLLTPTRIYAQSIVGLLRSYKVKKVISAMAHITGGGLADNLERVLPKNVDAVVDRSAWNVPAVFRFLQSRGRVQEEEMRRVFNMGIGYVVVVRPAFAAAVTEKLERSGERVFTIGKITKGSGRVTERD